MQNETSQFLSQMHAEEERWTSAHDYLACHARRFRDTLNLCALLKPDPATRVLDIGRSYLSYLLAGRYESVTTLGLPLNSASGAHGSTPPRSEGREPAEHIVYDLNDSGRKPIPTTEHFDLIVFAETIEHLVTPPELVLHALSGLLAADGFVIVETPNAVSGPNRIRMLLGQNPFERLRCISLNPGHIREYTRLELIEMGRTAGLQAVRHEYVHYSPLPRRPGIGTVAAAARLLVPSLRGGQTIVYRSARNA